MGGKTTERNRITNTAMYVRQTIEIRPNNKQKTYFRQCFGAHRLAYNYGLAEWIRRRGVFQSLCQATSQPGGHNDFRAAFC